MSPSYASSTSFPSLLRELVAIPGLSGMEDAIASHMAQRWQPFADAVWIDAIGNVIARFGEPSPNAIAVLAHIDTVGMLVRRHNPDGTLGVVAVGGINLKSLPGTPVRVGNAPGVIGVRSQHQARGGDEAASADDLYIHTADARQVEIATPVTYAAEPVAMGDLFASPYLDNRAGCAALLAAAEHIQNPAQTVYLIGTVQEETNSAGAYPVLNALRPACAVFVDGTVSYDTPESRGKGSVVLGGGPVLTAFLYISGANGWHADPQLRAHLKAVATQQHIPYQQDATHGLMSDSKVATWLGLPSAIIGIPMRGKHSQMEMLDLRDLTQTVELLTHALHHPLPTLKRGSI